MVIDGGEEPSSTPERAAPASVRVAQAKGRPMLSWVGKRPLREVRAFPAQLVSRFEPPAPDGAVAADVGWSEWPDRFDRGGLLFHGDNKEVLAHLLANGFRGKVDLVYIDPPFDSGADYVRKVQLRGPTGTARLDGEPSITIRPGSTVRPRPRLRRPLRRSQASPEWERSRGSLNRSP